jgi:signal transduction histidine kinase
MQQLFFIESLHSVLIAIRQKKPIETIMELILEQSCQIAKVTNGGILALNEQTEELKFIATAGPGWTLENKAYTAVVGKGVIGTAAQTQNYYLCRDTSKDAVYIKMFDFVQSELAVPIIVDDKVWGVINIDGIALDAFDDQIVELVCTLAELAATAIGIRQEAERHEVLQQRLLQSEKLAALGQVIAGIAHEINNPLTAILGHACLLEMKAGQPIDPKAIKSIISEAERVAELVKDLLSFSRKSPAKAQIWGVNGILKQACSFIRHQFKTKGCSLIVKLPETSYPILIDRRQLQQALINLISNGLQAIPENRTDGYVRLEVDCINDRVLIRISDNGVGIPDEIRTKVFEPFFTTKKVGQGTGLGLSITHSIIESHGGSISFKSESGVGTTFTLEFPLAEESGVEMKVISDQEEEQAQVSSAPSEPTLYEPQKRENALASILVIDDEQLLLNALAQYLESENFNVECALDADGAFSKINSSEFDFIVSDIRLPGKDGLQLYEEVCRIHPQYKRKFIFMTGDLIRELTRERVMKTRCFCLEKPFSFPILKNTLSILTNEDKEDAYSVSINLS